MVYYFCQAALIAGHESEMMAKEKEEHERQQRGVQSLDHQRQKHECTVSLQTKQYNEDIPKAERNSDRECGKLCDGLRKK